MNVYVFSAILVALLHTVQSDPYCPGNHWTKYYDRDNPSVTGDWETLKDLRKQHKEICAKPVEIQVTLVHNGLPWYTGNNYIDIPNQKNPTFGFVCLNKLQKKYYKPPCKDYKVRFCCLPEPKCHKPGHWTPWFDVDNPSTPGDWETLDSVRKQYPTVCTHPTGVHAVLTDHSHYLTGGDKVHLSNKGLICKNAEQKDGKCHDYKVRFCCVYKEPKCYSPAYWTQWFDRDNPSVTGDWETFDDLRKEHPGKLCKYPLTIQGQLVDGRPWQAEAENVHVSKQKGLICKNADQKDKYCHDYKVRFCCKKECYWTGWLDHDDPSATGDWETIKNLKKHDKYCHPSKIEAVTRKGHIPAHKTGQKFTYYDIYKGFACENKKQPMKGYFRPPCHDYKVRYYCC